jgi:AcrR family transcriptional regulator
MVGVTVRQRYLDAVVEAMITSGRVDLPLATLAAAAGTSDRMLVYYFGTRDALVAEAIDQVRERRRQLANTVMVRVSLAPSAVEGIADALRWMADPDQLPVVRLLRQATASALTGDTLHEAFADHTLSDWIAEGVLTGRRLGADAPTAEQFATLLVGLADALAVDLATTGDVDRVGAAIDAAAALLAHLVGAPTTPPPPPDLGDDDPEITDDPSA